MIRVLLIAALLVLTACAPAPRTDAAALPPERTPERAAEASATPERASPVSPAATAAHTVQASATPAGCAERRGKLRDVLVETALLPDPLPVRVYTPPCFDPGGVVRYPVLYLLHGQNYTFSHWDDLGADEAADGLIASGEAQPFLIVMPQEDLDLVDTRESAYGRRWWRRCCRGSSGRIRPARRRAAGRLGGFHGGRVGRCM